MTFEFVADSKFKDLLLRDYQELQACLKISAAKSVLVMAGSIIEALLIEYFVQFLPTGHTEKTIHALTFEQLLDLAEKQTLLSKREKNLAWVVKDYRNLIHSGREIRKSESFSMADARVSNDLIGIVVTAIENKYKQSYGYTADDIIAKLKHDWQFRTIFEKVILKLNQRERVKLLAKLIDNDVYEKTFWDISGGEDYDKNREIHNLEFAKEFASVLKPLVPNAVIVGHLKELINELETGDPTKAFVLFNLFHEDLNYLGTDEIEMVIVYVFSLFSSILEKCNDLNHEKTFSTIGKYITTEKGKKALKEFGIFCVVHFGGNSVINEFDVFEQVYNSLSEENKAILIDEVTTCLGNPENLPKDIKEGFYKHAIQRGILVAS